MSDTPKKMKVTDRRMFTSDGNLREEFQDLKDAAVPSAHAQPREETPPTATAQPAPAPAPGPAVAAAPTGPLVAAEPEDEKTESGATFYDLVAMLAQTSSVYLSQASQQLEQRGELLEMARMHIDLLTVLERKTRGNLDAEEKAMLEDAVYRLRMAFVELGG